jgi:tetracycline 7-halogenase / FADH2 O2-dependent halogenase
MVVDFGIIGSGFASCVLAVLLRRLGKRCVILEAHQHPRFAIGESSTPLADQLLLDFGREFRLPELSRLGRWSTARHLPDVVVGCKRGFSYFFHAPNPNSATAVPLLLVPASPDQAAADSHWHRGSVDHYLARVAVARGVRLYEQTRVISLKRQAERWHVTAQRVSASSPNHPETLALQCDFLVDASGPAGVVPTLLAGHRAAEAAAPSDGLPQETPWKFATDSGAMYGHFALPIDWPQHWRAWGLDSRRFSFPPDQAALHHVTRDGWLWHLGFDNDVVSLGWVLPSASWAALGERPTAAQKMAWWEQQWQRLPALAPLYQSARLVDPPGGLAFLPRLQRFRSPAVGEGWLALPNTVGFVDPLHSTGIAHSLYSVQKIVRTLQRQATLDERFLHEYAARLANEFWLVDQLVSLAYLSGGDPQKWEAATMVYFAAAIAAEEYRSQGRVPQAASPKPGTGGTEGTDPPWPRARLSLGRPHGLAGARRAGTGTPLADQGPRLRVVGGHGRDPGADEHGRLVRSEIARCVPLHNRSEVGLPIRPRDVVVRRSNWQ